jgi:hypothetical protein
MFCDAVTDGGSLSDAGTVESARIAWTSRDTYRRVFASCTISDIVPIGSGVYVTLDVVGAQPLVPQSVPVFTPTNLTLTGMIDLDVGDYTFMVQIGGSDGGGATWGHVGLQIIIGQVVSERHCWQESGGDG